MGKKESDKAKNQDIRESVKEKLRQENERKRDYWDHSEKSGGKGDDSTSNTGPRYEKDD